MWRVAPALMSLLTLYPVPDRHLIPAGWGVAGGWLHLCIGITLLYLFLNDFCMLSCFWTEQMLKYSMAMMETICVSGCRNVWPSFKCKKYVESNNRVLCLRFFVSYYYTKRVRNKHLREIYLLVSNSKWPKHAIKYNIHLGNVSFKNTCQPIWGVRRVTDVPLWFVVLHWDGPCWLAEPKECQLLPRRDTTVSITCSV